jgi:hypothetical protein
MTDEQHYSQLLVETESKNLLFLVWAGLEPQSSILLISGSEIARIICVSSGTQPHFILDVKNVLRSA